MTRRTLFAALALAFPVVWALAHLAGGATTDDTELLGARLGMSARQIRSSFQPEGSWSSSTEGELLVLEWSGEDSRVKSARFELHEGLLVAIRADLADVSDDRVVAPDVVRDVRDGHLTLIARGCPAHVDEVARLLRR